MSKRQLEEMMWADACAAMDRAERLRRQFFHHGQSRWEAPIDVFETDDALTILVALPGVELDSIKVTLNAGTLIDHRRASAAAGIEERAHPADGNPLRAVRAPDRVAAGAVPDFGASPRQWLPDAAPRERIMAMTPDEQQTRTETGAAPAGAPAVAAPGGAEIGLAIPEDALILVTTRNLVLFPGTVLPMTLGRQRSVVAAQTAIRLSRPVGLVLQRDPSMDAPMPADLHRSGPRPTCCAT